MFILTPSTFLLRTLYKYISKNLALDTMMYFFSQRIVEALNKLDIDLIACHSFSFKETRR